MKRILVLALLAGCGGPNAPAPSAHARRWIDAPRLMQDVRALSDPALRGRGPADRGGGEAIAAAWIAERMRKIGLDPVTSTVPVPGF
jgi:hypothetical protein